MKKKARKNDVIDLNYLVERLEWSLKSPDVFNFDDADAPEWKAQLLIYDSVEAEEDTDALELIRKALELYPACIDGWLGLIDFGVIPAEEQLGLLQTLVQVGEKKLGDDFHAFKGHFWGFVETRPYMRARGMLAAHLVGAGRLDEAVVEYVGMLELNPHDNQGMRYELMGKYLMLGDFEGVRRLLKKYDEGLYFAVWAWARILEEFVSGKPEKAARTLVRAQKMNPYMRAFIQGDLTVPPVQPKMFAVGTLEEAIVSCPNLLPGWNRYPEALAWLRASPMPKRVEKKAPKKAAKKAPKKD